MSKEKIKVFIDIIRELRPKQWTKNIIIFAALIFSKNLFQTVYLLSALLAFAGFCLISSAVYVMNDLVDRERDRQHPIKRRRPIAAGRIGLPSALVILFLLLALAGTAASFLNRGYMLVMAVYFIIQIGYSFYIKHVVILDVFAVASGFFLRAIAGGYAINVPLSSWLLICTILLSLFLAISKRRQELVMLESGAGEHRAVLGSYSTILLDQMIAIVTSSTVVAYSLYTLSPETAAKFHTENLVFTVPLVLYAIFRYLYLIYQKGEGGRPEKVLLTDIPIIIDLILYAVIVGVILYL